MADPSPSFPKGAVYMRCFRPPGAYLSHALWLPWTLSFPRPQGIFIVQKQGAWESHISLPACHQQRCFLGGFGDPSLIGELEVVGGDLGPNY